MQNKHCLLPRLLDRVLRAMCAALALMFRFCCRMVSMDFEIALIPGLLTCNINLRAGGSGRARHHSTYKVKEKIGGVRLAF